MLFETVKRDEKIFVSSALWPGRANLSQSGIKRGGEGWGSGDLPAGFRRILGLLENEIATAEFLHEVQEVPIAQVLDWLEQLETLGFIEVTPRSEDSQSWPTLLSDPFQHAA